MHEEKRQLCVFMCKKKDQAQRDYFMHQKKMQEI